MLRTEVRGVKNHMGLCVTGGSILSLVVHVRQIAEGRWGIMVP